jgi:hypothetical protein
MSSEWYYAGPKGQVGPIDLEDLKRALVKAKDPDQILVWRTGFSEWMRAGDVPEVALRRSPPPLPEELYVPAKNPQRLLRPSPEFPKGKELIRGIIGLFVLGFFIVGLSSGGSKPSNTVPNDGNKPSNTASGTTQASAPAGPSCKTDYTMCQDNADMINNYGKMYYAKAACKIAVNKSARFGEPDWSWVPFGKFYPGNEYPRTGVVKIADDDVKIRNAFNTPVRSMVVCQYSFPTQQATILRAE